MGSVYNALQSPENPTWNRGRPLYAVALGKNINQSSVDAFETWASAASPINRQQFFCDPAHKHMRQHLVKTNPFPTLTISYSAHSEEERTEN